MNYLFSKTALIMLMVSTIIGCVSSQDAADIESKLSPASELKTVGNLKVANKEDADEVVIQQETVKKQNSGIEEGQFVLNGFENTLKVEIVKVKRIQNPETQKQDIVVVSFRVKRLTEKILNYPNNFLKPGEAKTRNKETLEEYQTVEGKHTKRTHFKKLSLKAWADAFFWSQVPEGIEIIDIIIPQTAIFKNVPIEG